MAKKQMIIILEDNTDENLTSSDLKHLSRGFQDVLDREFDIKIIDISIRDINE